MSSKKVFEVGLEGLGYILGCEKATVSSPVAYVNEPTSYLPKCDLAFFTERTLENVAWILLGPPSLCFFGLQEAHLFSLVLALALAAAAAAGAGAVVVVVVDLACRMIFSTPALSLE